MKRKTKVLLGTLIPLGAITLTTVGVVGGIHVKNKKLIDSISNETVNIFTQGLCPIYRKTYNTRKVADYIKNLVESWGISVTEDNYKPDPLDPLPTDVPSGNLYYDIPSSSGCDNWKGVTLQAHMDMVCEPDPSLSIYDWSKGVDIVQEGNILHSRDYKTNIGADDGVGLSMILALTKYRDKFTHGPIRVLITADEEDGIAGASVVDANELRYARVINIDASNPGEIIKSCAGTYGVKTQIEMNWTDVTSTYKQYNVSILNVNGPHSGEITKDNISTVKLTFDFLKDLANSSNVELLEINISGANNRIPTNASFSFATDKADADQWITNKLNSIKAKYPLETRMTTDFFELTDTKKFEKALSKSETDKLIDLFGTVKDPTQDKIPFGVIEWIDEEKTKPATSSNIRPVSLQNNEVFKFETLTRSCYAENQDIIAKGIIGDVKEAYSNATFNESITPPWEFKENVPLVDLIAKGFNKYKVPTKVSDSHGWLECSFFANANPDAQIASIGAKVVDEHKTTESTDISSYPCVIKTLIYTLQNIK